MDLDLLGTVMFVVCSLCILISSSLLLFWASLVCIIFLVHEYVSRTRS
jgi:hypothetical protein